MKYIISIVSLCIVSLTLFIGSYYKNLQYDIEKIKPYITEMNFIVYEYNDNYNYVFNNNTEYINRISKIKKGIKNTKISLLIEDYIKYKISAIESFEKYLSSKDEKYLKAFNKYNTIAEKELDEISNNNLIKVTYLSTISYYK